jgi:undecaprenyl-diphosphatase
VERPDADSFPLLHAVCLGIAHGPAELLPISSSGHVTLIAWLAGWPYPELELALRKDFEVALHAGTAAALLFGGRGALPGAAALHDRRAALVLALALGPPALAGLALEARIERLGTPGRIAGGLLAGALGMALADALGASGRTARDARPADGLLLGLAQAAALVPGVSRNGATLAVCRARGFRREAADELSRECGLLVIVGAAALRGLHRRAPGGSGRPAITPQLAAGALAAFVSTLAAGRALERRARPVGLLACAAYRTALAGVVLARLARRRSGRSGAAGARSLSRHTPAGDERTICMRRMRRRR